MLGQRPLHQDTRSCPFSLIFIMFLVYLMGIDFLLTVLVHKGIDKMPNEKAKQRKAFFTAYRGTHHQTPFAHALPFGLSQTYDPQPMFPYVPMQNVHSIIYHLGGHQEMYQNQGIYQNQGMYQNQYGMMPPSPFSGNHAGFPPQSYQSSIHAPFNGHTGVPFPSYLPTPQPSHQSGHQSLQGTSTAPRFEAGHRNMNQTMAQGEDTHTEQSKAHHVPQASVQDHAEPIVPEPLPARNPSAQDLSNGPRIIELDAEESSSEPQQSVQRVASPFRTLLKLKCSRQQTLESPSTIEKDKAPKYESSIEMSKGPDYENRESDIEFSPLKPALQEKLDILNRSIKPLKALIDQGKRLLNSSGLVVEDVEVRAETLDIFLPPNWYSAHTLILLRNLRRPLPQGFVVCIGDELLKVDKSTERMIFMCNKNYYWLTLKVSLLDNLIACFDTMAGSTSYTSILEEVTHNIEKALSSAGNLYRASFHAPHFIERPTFRQKDNHSCGPFS